MALGRLVVFRKGKTSAPYELDEGEHSIGSSQDSNIRLKFTHPLLLETHALIRVNKNGVATILNKSVGAPVRVNGKLALKPTILKHEDKFEILEKIFQYFNENLKDEPEDSGKFVKEQKNILATNRQSVHPVVRTPVKKSPNLKTKISSTRKSMSAVSRPSKGLHFTITPNKKPDRHIGSKTTSKVIVSKALVSPHTAKKRRLSLDNENKASKIPKISSRNILLSKSTINITISEEHEYSEITPLTQEEGKNANGRTPRRSIRVENTDTPNKNISVDLIDLNSPYTPAVNSPRRNRPVRRASLPHQSSMDTLTNENTSNVMKTPVNKRIQSLKTIRHSLKKDTPPPKLTIPKVRIQPATPRDGKKYTDVSVNGDNDDISISYSPNAEPSSHNFTLKESKTPRRSIAKKYEETGTPGNKSRVSFAIEAPTEGSLINLETLNEFDHSTDENNRFLPLEKDNSQSARKFRGNKSVVNEGSSKSKQGLAATEEIEPDLELPKSQRYSLNSTRTLGDSLLEDRNEKAGTESLQIETRKSRSSKRYSKAGSVLLPETPDSDEKQDSTRKSLRNIILSETTDDSDAERLSWGRKSEQRTHLTKSEVEDVIDYKSSAQSPRKAPNSRNTSLTGTKVQNESFLSENDMLAEPLHDSSADEMDELRIEENISSASDKSLNTSKNISTRNSHVLNNSDKSTKVSANVPRTTNYPNKSGLDISQNKKLEKSTTIFEDDGSDSANVSKHSRVSRTTSRRSTKQTENVGKVPSSSRLSRNVSTTSEATEESVDFSQTEDIDIAEYANKSSRASRSISKRTSKIEAPAEAPQTENNDTDEESNANKSSRVSRTLSRKSIKIEALSNSSQTDSSISDEIENVNKSSRASRNVSRRTSKMEVAADHSQKDEETTDEEDNVNNSYQASRKAPVETSHTEYDEQNNPNRSSRVSRTLSRKSVKIEALSNSSQTDSSISDETENVNKSSRASRSVSRRTSKIEVAADHSQRDKETTDEEDNVNKSYQASRKAPVETSHTEYNDTDEQSNPNRSSRVSRTLSRKSVKIEALSNSSQTDSSISDETENVNKSSRASRSVSKRTSKIEVAADHSQRDKETTDEEDNVNKSYQASRKAPVETSHTEYNDTDEQNNPNRSSRVSRTLSRKSVKIEALSNSSQTDSSISDETENVNKSSRSVSRRTSKMEVAADRSQTDNKTTDEEDNVNNSYQASRKTPVETSHTEYNDTDEQNNPNRSSRVSRTLSRRSIKVEALSNSSQTDSSIMDVTENDNKSSRALRHSSRQSTKNNETIDLSQIKGNTTNVEEKHNNSSRVSRNISRRSNNLERLSCSLLTEDNSTYADKSVNKSTRSSKNVSGIANVSTIKEVSAKTSGNVSRRSARALDAQSSINSAETTMDVQQENEEQANISNSAKNRSVQRWSVFDESTQEAKSNINISINRSKQRVSIFDESTKEALQEVDTKKSMKPIRILDDTQEVLSPVRPLSPRKSIRNIQNQDLEGSISPSTRVSSIRKSRTKNQTLQDSSLTSTSMDQSSSSVISVSSQSFSSFKRASSRRDDTQSDTEIDVVNISSTMETTEVKQRASSVKAKSKVLEESNASRSSKRQTRTSEMFRDVSCTSTPFHKNLSKRSDASGSRNMTKTSRASSSTILDSKRPELISISSSNDSVFMNSTEEKKNRSNSVLEQPEVSRRSSSRRSSISNHAGEHNCISCNNSSVKRSRSLSASVEPLVSSRPSKSPRISAGAMLELNYKATSPVKKLSGSMSSNMTTPLLHRKSLATSLSEKTPEKAPDTEDETPKSSIKPARRSSKGNQSAYNPLLEDITPVTPEKLMVSGFTEDVFKTPINTPGLFENIRKSVIRSRKRHRESTGSTMKDSKRARVDFTQDEQLEASIDPQPHKPQKSPVNRLSNFEGIKRLMRTPPKSPKNDLANVTGVKEMFSSPTDRTESPRKNLSNIPDLLKLVSPKRRTTPRKELPQVPDLKRIMSSRQQNSPKNIPRLSVSGKQLAKTPKVQKEPVNDLTNITGVSNIFNVSGVEVLHQGSDIENSEDLFTQLTGKRPVKAYPRGKSLSPSKTQQEQTHSRKTMGDIPVCSPRVQQWVEDHANVMYTSIEKVPVTPLHEDVLINVSDKPKRRSKSGRSVSPKTHLQEKRNRRKTQGDALGNSPNAAAWKAERATQARTCKSSPKQTVVTAEIKSSNPMQTLQLTGTKAEKVTPQQLKSNIESLIPQQQMDVLVGTASSKTAKRPKKVVEEQSMTPQQRSAEMTPQKLMNECSTPASTKAKRGRSRKDINDQQMETLQLPKSKEDESAPHEQITTLDNVASPASAKAKRGRTKKVATEKLSNRTQTVASSSTSNKTVKLVTEHEPQQQVSVTPKEIENKPLEAVKRGGRSKRLLSNEELDIVSSTTASPAQQPLTKRNKTRRGKVDSQSEPIFEDMELKIVPTSRTRRAQMPSETAPIAEVEIKKPARGKQRKIKVDDSENVSASPVRKGGRRENKAVEMENEPNKNDRKDALPIENDTHKLVPKGGVVKKNIKEKPVENADNVVEIPEVKKTASKGKRGQKIIEENRVDIVTSSPVDTKKLPTGRRGKKVDIVESKDVADEIPKAEVKKPALRGRRGKKEEIQEEPEIKPSRKDTKTDMPEHIEEPVVEKTTRNRKGKKVEETEEKTTQLILKEVKLRGRGQKNRIQDEDTDDNTDPEVEFNKRPTRARAKKDEPQAEIAEVIPETTARGRRGAKVVVVDEPKQPTKKGRKASKTEETPEVARGRGQKNHIQVEENDDNTDTEVEFNKRPTRGRAKKAQDSIEVAPETKGRGRRGLKVVVVDEPEKPAKKGGKASKTEETPEIVESPKKPPTKHRGKKVMEQQTTEDQAVSQSSQKQNPRKLKNKVIEEVIEMDVDSPRTARAKRGMNKKYSTDEYEITENNGGSKRKVHFEDGNTAEVDTRKSKRTRK